MAVCKVWKRQVVCVNEPVAMTAAQPLWHEVEMPKWQPNRTLWLVSFVDLTALLVAFFVLLFSTQTLQRDKWEAVTGSFQQQFARRETVVPVIPDGGDNAVVRVTGVKSGLAYLDTLLLQRMQGDAVWGGLQAARQQGELGGELRYALPQAALEGTGAHDAWMRLAGVIRGWKNSVGVRVSAPAAQLKSVAGQALTLGGKLQEGGVVTAFTELAVEDGISPRFELVVRAQ